MIKRILLGLGCTARADVATAYAVELACLHRAQLTGMAVLDAEHLTRPGAVPLGGGAYAQKSGQRRLQTARERIEASMGRFEQVCSSAGVAYKAEYESGDAGDLITAAARYHDLIVCSLEGLFDYGVTGGPRLTLEHLIEYGARPVLVTSLRYRAVRRALIAYSGSIEAAKAMKRFVQLRPWGDVALRIACFGKEGGDALLQDAADYCRAHGYEPQVENVQQSPRAGLLHYAQRNEADLVVMGSSLRHLLLRRLLGDIVLHAIKHADRPLFLSQ